MKNILITGGAGFIGSHVALKLAGKGYEVTVLDICRRRFTARIRRILPRYIAVSATACASFAVA